jgi:NAD(P)-dependent dehydrogenase (short-subunit alcohol dehydrogenase family)
MTTFSGGLAVITGGGDGMGQDLAVQLASEGCDVAICDLTSEKMERTRELASAGSPEGTLVSIHECDVSDERQLERFRDEIVEQHAADHITMLFNNAGIGGGGSMVVDGRDTWERCFAVCWGGVYLGTRVFLPLLMAAEASHIVNTSSVNGLWASLGPERPHTSYSAAKFAVRGFTEALIQDLAMHAPNVQAHVVFPGHVGTGIAGNTVVAHGIDPAIDPAIMERAAAFRNAAPTTSASAATIILDAVRAGEWRILVGEDAHVLDSMVRDRPTEVYGNEFLRDMAGQNVLGNLLD